MVQPQQVAVDLKTKRMIVTIRVIMLTLVLISPQISQSPPHRLAQVLTKIAMILVQRGYLR